eukprot:TRINITY_DN16072_c0_g1_i1.p1 TRINITY_DN16072_c0_g1~~TRINITY_DN16072_c0_g1_i1.p1  ORF type:complete len:682 (-),score=59.04 TRINITY_DN16072_c0_g1_i1:86-2131(-)
MTGIPLDYELVLRERMVNFSIEDLNRHPEAQKEAGYEHYEKGYVPPEDTQLRVISLSQRGGDVLGTLLSGSEAFCFPGSLVGSSVDDLLHRVAATLEEDVGNLSLREVEKVLEPCETVSDAETLFVVQSITDKDAVLVCTPLREHNYGELGEGIIKIDFDSARLIQAVRERRKFVTEKGEGDFCYLVYTKNKVLTHICGGSCLRPVGFFPSRPAWPLPPLAQQLGACGLCDVWTASVALPTVGLLLDAHAASTNDRPIPRYQMIVDPNQFVHKTPRGYTWVPCEFDIDTSGVAHLVGGNRSHQFPELAEGAATPVLTAALPLLAKLRRPRLLLDGRRIQAVFKAQRIIVPASAVDAESAQIDSEYIGLWHVDGELEHVAAVVLYYYTVGESLQGGDMEFCGREPMDMLGRGDNSNNFRDFSGGALRKALIGDDSGSKYLQACRAPIRKGTLLVFSNYQMIHRVLRMVNTSTEKEASRDFVALFILDPANEQRVTSRMMLAKSYVLSRTLTHSLPSAGSSCTTFLAQSYLQLIAEFAGLVPSQKRARARRCKLLKRQLKPAGCFSGGGNVYSTGNGCLTMIGWMHHMLTDDFELEGMADTSDNARMGYARLRGLNLPPCSVGRGMSENLSLPEETLDELLEKGFADLICTKASDVLSSTSDLLQASADVSQNLAALEGVQGF